MAESEAGKRILISGGSGLLGQAITDIYQKYGFEVAWLSRRQTSELNKGIRIFSWDPARLAVDPEAIKWADSIINLAGTSIGETRWTPAGRKEILESRLLSVKTLEKGLTEANKVIDSFIGVSGAGYYGAGEKPFKETDLPGKGFPADVAKKWEEAYFNIPSDVYKKRCILRLAVVLSTKGGAMPKIMQPISFGLGAALGTGKQAFNWIHIDDAAKGFFEARNWSGIYNLSAPGKANNLQATQAIAKAMGKRIFFPPVPEFFLKIGLGDRAQLLTEGNYSDVSKISGVGFSWLHPEIEEATAHLIKSGI